MVLKFLFDRIVALIGLIALCWLYPIVAILIKIKMPGPVLFVQKRVGKDGRLFSCHKFRTMISVKNHEGREAHKGDKAWSTVSVSGDARITPFGAKLRHHKIDELRNCGMYSSEICRLLALVLTCQVMLTNCRAKSG